MKTQIVAVTFVIAGVICAQSANPLSMEARQVYTSVKNNILRSAEKMPEGSYGFKPAPRYALSDKFWVTWRKNNISSIAP